MNNTCVCCGEIIPEGRQVCLNCERKTANKTTIIERIGKPAALEQLAEEATELAQAALKYARKLRGENYTPKTIDELTANLVEEYTDVIVCGMCLNLHPDFEIMFSKMKRWEERIQNEHFN